MKVSFSHLFLRFMLSLSILACIVPLGQQTVMASTLGEAIAYVVPNTPNGDEIHLIKPDGSGDRLVYRTGIPIPENLSDILSLAWKPDASELAFSGAQENTCSQYAEDIYTISPDGSNYRRITDPPACGARAGLPTGTVTVPVYNNSGSRGPFIIYVDGAPGSKSLVLDPGDTMDVTFTNVADYGAKAQYAVWMAWDVRAPYPGAKVDVLPGKAVRTGVLSIGIGFKHWGFNWPAYLPDGSKMATIFNQNYLFVFDPNGQIPDWTTPEQFKFGLSGSALRWGPTEELKDYFLYYGAVTDSGYGVRESVFLGNLATGQKVELFDVDPHNQGDLLLGLAWLPDGSGFIYSYKQMITIWEPDFNLYEVSNIWEYSFATGQSTQLTDVPHYTWTRMLSVSPDGSQIVFEHQPSGDWIDANPPTNLYTMNRDGSGISLLVEGGRSPAWSPAEIPDRNPVPVLAGLNPSAAGAGGPDFRLTVSGSNFVSSSVVRWNGAALATTYVDANTLTAEVPAAKIAATGTASVTVYSPGPGGGVSAAKTFTINNTPPTNPAPVLGSLNPSVVDAGGSGLALKVTGSKFVQSSVVRWNGANLPTTFGSTTGLTAQVTAAQIASTGPVSVTVFNPAPGGGESEALTLSIVNPEPVLTGLSPDLVNAGGAGFILAVNGSKFTKESVVSWNGTDMETTYVSATRLTVKVSAAKIASVGAVPVKVSNPAPSGGESQTLTLKIDNLPYSLYLPAVKR